MTENQEESGDGEHRRVVASFWYQLGFYLEAVRWARKNDVPVKELTSLLIAAEVGYYLAKATEEIVEDMKREVPPQRSKIPAQTAVEKMNKRLPEQYPEPPETQCHPPFTGVRKELGES